MSLAALCRRLIASVGVFGTLVALVISLKPPHEGLTLWQSALVTAFCIFGIADLVFDVVDYLSSRPKNYKGKVAIRNYMYEWIRTGGAVEIYSRDMSWVEDDEMRSMLLKKAQDRELTLVLPESIDLSRSLDEAGARVFNYPSIRVTMRSRFTIVNSGRTDSKVAIGRSKGENHVVEEFAAADDHPAFYLAQDLSAIIRAFCAPAEAAESEATS